MLSRHPSDSGDRVVLGTTSRDEAVTEIIDALIAAGALSPELKDEFIKAIVKREKRGSTGFGHGVAVPHVKHSAISKMAVAVATSRKPGASLNVR